MKKANYIATTTSLLLAGFALGQIFQSSETRRVKASVEEVRAAHERLMDANDQLMQSSRNLVAADVKLKEANMTLLRNCR